MDLRQETRPQRGTKEVQHLGEAEGTRHPQPDWAQQGPGHWRLCAVACATQGLMNSPDSNMWDRSAAKEQRPAAAPLLPNALQPSATASSITRHFWGPPFRGTQL